MNETELFRKAQRIEPRAETWQRIVSDIEALRSQTLSEQVIELPPGWRKLAIAATLALTFVGSLTWYAGTHHPSQVASTEGSAQVVSDSLDLSEGLVSYAFEDLDPDSLFTIASNTP